MSRLINRMADRVLAAVAPKADAHAAGCTTVTRYCYCSNNRIYTRVCTICPGFEGCNSCVQTSVHC
jgi:hypothetical protein